MASTIMDHLASFPDELIQEIFQCIPDGSDRRSFWNLCSRTQQAVGSMLFENRTLEIDGDELAQLLEYLEHLNSPGSMSNKFVKRLHITVMNSSLSTDAAESFDEATLNGILAKIRILLPTAIASFCNVQTVTWRVYDSVMVPELHIHEHIIDGLASLQLIESLTVDVPEWPSSETAITPIAFDRLCSKSLRTIDVAAAAYLFPDTDDHLSILAAPLGGLITKCSRLEVLRLVVDAPPRVHYSLSGVMPSGAALESVKILELKSWGLSPAMVPHLRSLETLITWYEHSAWKHLLANRINPHTVEINGDMSQVALSFLDSLPILHSLSVANNYSSGGDDQQLAAHFFERLIPKHASTLTALRVVMDEQSHWVISVPHVEMLKQFHCLQILEVFLNPDQVKPGRSDDLVGILLQTLLALPYFEALAMTLEFPNRPGTSNVLASAITTMALIETDAVKTKGPVTIFTIFDGDIFDMANFLSTRDEHERLYFERQSYDNESLDKYFGPTMRRNTKGLRAAW